jgi:hypothetical protein
MSVCLKSCSWDCRKVAGSPDSTRGNSCLISWLLNYRWEPVWKLRSGKCVSRSRVTKGGLTGTRNVGGGEGKVQEIVQIT